MTPSENTTGFWVDHSGARATFHAIRHIDFPRSLCGRALQEPLRPVTFDPNNRKHHVVEMIFCCGTCSRAMYGGRRR